MLDLDVLTRMYHCIPLPPTYPSGNWIRDFLRFPSKPLLFSV